MAQKYEARFSSSVLEGPGKDELEMPIPMVCIVATTVSLIHCFLFKDSADVSRTMLRSMIGVRGISGAKATSALILMKIFTEVMSCS